MRSLTYSQFVQCSWPF